MRVCFDLTSMSRHYRGMTYSAIKSGLIAGAFAALLVVVPVGIVLAQSGDTGEKGLEEEVRSGADVIESLLNRLHDAEDIQTAGILEEAILRAWLVSGSETIDLLMSRTVIAMREDDLPLALDFCNAIVDLAPEFSEGWNKRATVLYMLKDFRGSLDDVERTLELEPRHFGALSGLGLILLELGNQAGALKAFRLALDVHPFLENARKSVERLELEVEGRGI